MSALDVLGNEVDVDDRIAMAFREGNSGHLRVGIVRGFGAKSAYPEDVQTMEVAWLTSSSSYDRTYLSGKVTSVETHHRRFIRLG